MDSKPGAVISRKELIKLVFLIGLTVICSSILYDYLRRAAKTPPSPNLAQDNEIRPTSRLTVPPFTPDPTVLQQAEDDAYLKTAPFYYLVHRMLAMPQAQVDKEVDPLLTWDALKDISRRHSYRGQVMRVRGSLLRLRRFSLEGKEAQARGLTGCEVWEGFIYNVRNYLFAFVVTELPPEVRKGDHIEVTGAFLKIWEYTNAGGEISHTPVVVGKSFRSLPRPESPGARQLTWPFLLLMATIAMIVLATLWRERRKHKALSQLVSRIRRQRVKNPAK